jgi:hypothetical protein
LIHFLDGVVPATDIFGELGTSGWLHWDSSVQWAVLYSQNCVLLIFVWYIGMVPSAGFIMTHHIIFTIIFNFISVFSFFLVASLHLGYVFTSNFVHAQIPSVSEQNLDHCVFHKVNLTFMKSVFSFTGLTVTPF